MIKKVQENAEGYPFVFLTKAHCETLRIKKGTRVDIRVEGRRLSITPVAAPLTKEEPQQAVASPMNGETSNARL